MSDDAMEKSFTGPIPQVYDTCLVPMIFAPIVATDLHQAMLDQASRIGTFQAHVVGVGK